MARRLPIAAIAARERVVAEHSPTWNDSYHESNGAGVQVTEASADAPPGSRTKSEACLGER
jgi:hypothetical protein